MMRRLKSLPFAYGRLSLREQVLVGGCMVAVLGFLGYTWVLAPMEAQRSVLQQRINQDRATLTRDTAQIAALDSQLRDQESALRARMAELNRELARQDGQFREIQAHLVSPKDMPRLLQSLLARRGSLQMVSLRSIAPQLAGDAPTTAGSTELVAGAPPVLAALAAQSAPKAAASSASPAPAPADSTFYRHSVEVTVRGSYADLLAYVQDLEKLPQKMLWQELRFKVDEYPRITLSLVVQTLSLESTWLQM